MLDTLPKRIAARRARRERRRAHVAGAGLSTLLVSAALATFAIGDPGTPGAPCAPVAAATGPSGPTGPTGAAEDCTTDTTTGTTTDTTATTTTTAAVTDTSTSSTPRTDAPTGPTGPTGPAGTTTDTTTPPVDTTPAVPEAPEVPQTPTVEAQTPTVPQTDATAVAQAAAAAATVPQPATLPVVTAPKPKLGSKAPNSVKPVVLTESVPEPTKAEVDHKARKNQSDRKVSDASTTNATTTGDSASADATTSTAPLPASARAVGLADLATLTTPTITDGDAADWTGPDALLPIYHAAGAEYDVPWSVLASINEIETNFGKNLNVSSAGAVGWMQFMPSTWDTYGVDGDGDGVRDPSDPVDAIFAAARYLKDSGAAKDIKGAVFSYNHAGWYVDKVLAQAQIFAKIDPDTLNALTERGRQQVESLELPGGDKGYLADPDKAKGLGQIMLLSDTDLRKRVLQDADFRGCQAENITSGGIDRRVLTVIEMLSQEDMRPTISALQCDHGLMTASGNVSEHSTGDAVDIAAINGTPILGHQGPGTITEDVITKILQLTGALSPHQIISLMTFPNAPNTFSMPDHYNHVHVGFRPAQKLA